MANELRDFKNGAGFVYITDKYNNILRNLRNSASGGNKAQVDALTSGALASELASRTVITFGGTTTGTIDNVTINGISITDGVTVGGTSLAQTAADFRDAVNAFTSSPDYFAYSSGNDTIIYANAGAGITPNGFAVVAVTLAGGLTATTPAMAGGTDAGAVTDSSFGRRYYLNADYSVDPVTGSGTAAVEGSLTNAVEITKFLIMQGLQSHFDFQSITLADDTLTVTRNGVVTVIDADTQGAAATDDLKTISTDGFNEGDLLIIRGSDAARVITITDLVSGNDNILLANKCKLSYCRTRECNDSQFFNIVGTGQRWIELQRSPAVTLGVASFRTAGLSFPAQGVGEIVITTGATTTLIPGTDKEYQLITGSDTLASGHQIIFGGTPKDGDRFHFKYAATITAGGGNDVSIAGITLTTIQALEGNAWVEAFYDIDTTSWKSSIFKDANGEDLVDAVQLATKEDGLGNPPVTGYFLSSTTGGVRSWAATSGGGGGLTSIPVSRTVFVDTVNGTDADGGALVGRLDKPFNLKSEALEKAILNLTPTATDRVLIKVAMETSALPISFTENTAGVDWDLSGGSINIVDALGFAAIDDNNFIVDSVIYNAHTLESNGASAHEAVRTEHAATVLTIHAKEIKSSVKGAVICDGGTQTIFANVSNTTAAVETAPAAELLVGTQTIHGDVTSALYKAVSCASGTQTIHGNVSNSAVSVAAAECSSTGLQFIRGTVSSSTFTASICSGGTQTVAGDVSYTGGAIGLDAVSCSGTGSQNITGEINTNGTGSSAYAIDYSSSGISSYTSNIVSSGAGVNQSAGTLTVTGSIVSTQNGADLSGGTQTINGDITSAVNRAVTCSAGVQNIYGNCLSQLSSPEIDSVICIGTGVQNIVGNIETDGNNAGAVGLFYASSGVSSYRGNITSAGTGVVQNTAAGTAVIYGSVTADLIAVTLAFAGANLTVNGDIISTATSLAVSLSDGKLVLGGGFRVETTSGATAISKTGGTLILNSNTIFSSTNSILSTGPQDVYVYGLCQANKIIDANTTVLVNTLTIDANVI